MKLSQNPTPVEREYVAAYNSMIYWIRRDSGAYRDHEKRAELLAKRQESHDRFDRTKAAYYAELKKAEA